MSNPARRLVPVLLLVAAATPLAAASGDAEAVKAVVQSAYVEGVHASPDAAAMRRGFHPDSRMLVLRDGALQAVTLDDWAARLAKRAADGPAAPKPRVKADYTTVDVTGDAAVVRVELHRDGKHVFTDYLALYRFPDGWKIVSKTFQSH